MKRHYTYYNDIHKASTGIQCKHGIRSMINETNLNKYDKCPCYTSEQKKKDMVKKESSEAGLDEAN